MSVVVASLTATWTDNNNRPHCDTMQVNGPTAVPDPDTPVVIFLHGMAGSSNDLSLYVQPNYAVDMTTPIVTADRGIHSYPGVGTYGFATDSPLSPPPVGWEPYLLSQNYLTLNYSQIDNTGSLALVNGQPSDPVRQLHAIVTCVATTFPGRRIAFVAHSRGGLLLRAWLVQHGTDAMVRPRLGTAVQLASPDQGSSLANIESALNATFVALAQLAQSYQIPIMQSPFYQAIEGQTGWPAIPDLQVGSAFLQWLAASEPNSRANALLECATFGGTNPNLFRCHLYVFTSQSAIPIFTWEGWYFAVTYHWYTWDVGFPVRNVPGDIGQALQAPAEIVPGEGDVLVAAASASLPWQAEHYVNPVNHGQVLWDASAKNQALPVLKNAWGSPAVQVEASWAVWAHPAVVLPGSQFTISVTVTNVGTVTWPSGCVVGADDGSGHAIWGASVAGLATMPRGASTTVNLALTTPTTAAVGRWLELDIYVAAAVGAQPIQRGQAPVWLLLETGGRLEAFARGPDGNLGHTWQNTPGGGWYPWTDLGPAITSGPAVSGNADGRLEVFANGPAPAGPPALGHIWQTTPGGGWSAWTYFGTIPGEWSITGDPAVFQNADGRLEVFAKGPDGNLGHTWQNTPGGSWSSWADLGPAITSDPAVSGNADGRLEVFAKGPDGNLGHTWQNTPGGSWYPWTDLGPAITGDPAVSGNADGRLEVFAKGPDGNLGHTWQNTPGGSWYPWTDLGPAITGDPAVSGNADGRLEVFAKGPDGNLGHTWQNTPGGSWSSWADLGPAITGDLAVSGNADGRLEVFAKGPDGNLGHTWQNTPGGSWSSWADLGPAIASSPAVAANKAGT